MNLIKLDPNDFTESKNPVLSLLFHTILGDMGDNSTEVQTLIQENELSHAFTDSLSDEQQDLFNELYWEEACITTKIEAERFILGFKLATMLSRETSYTAADSGKTAISDLINS